VSGPRYDYMFLAPVEKVSIMLDTINTKMSSCFSLSRFREVGKKIVAMGRNYRFYNKITD